MGVGLLIQKTKMKNSASIIQLSDGRKVLINRTQPIPDRMILFLCDDFGTPLKKAGAQFQILVKTFDDFKILMAGAKTIGYIN